MGDEKLENKMPSFSQVHWTASVSCYFSLCTLLISLLLLSHWIQILLLVMVFACINLVLGCIALVTSFQPTWRRSRGMAIVGITLSGIIVVLLLVFFVLTLHPLFPDLKDLGVLIHNKACPLGKEIRFWYLSSEKSQNHRGREGYCWCFIGETARGNMHCPRHAQWVCRNVSTCPHGGWQKSWANDTIVLMIPEWGHFEGKNEGLSRYQI